MTLHTPQFFPHDGCIERKCVNKFLFYDFYEPVESKLNHPIMFASRVAPFPAVASLIKDLGLPPLSSFLFAAAL